MLLGQLIENMKRGTEDRADIKKALEKLNDGQESLRRELGALQQTASSTASVLATIVSERHAERIKALEESVFDEDHQTHGDRLAKMEEKINHWDRIIGTGKALLLKIIGLVVGSAALQSAITHYVFGPK